MLRYIFLSETPLHFAKSVIELKRKQPTRPTSLSITMDQAGYA